MNIETCEYYVMDSTKEIVDEINAFTAKLEIHPSRKTEHWVLMHRDGYLDNNQWFSADEYSVCRKTDYFVPAEPESLRPFVKQGAEDEFDFFIKHGYHKPNQ